MEVKDGILKANGKLVIDRTDWGIRYSSGKFYDLLADQIVSDDIEFYIKIVETFSRKTGNSDFSTKPTDYYNLDVIISVGYRVKSLQGTKFRQWTTARLKKYIVKGFTMYY